MFQIIVSVRSVTCLAIVVISLYYQWSFPFVDPDKDMAATTVTTNAGVQMPRLIYGTAWKKEATTELVIRAVLNGFRGIDTACQPKHYR